MSENRGKTATTRAAMALPLDQDGLKRELEAARLLRLEHERKAEQRRAAASACCSTSTSAA
jgi:hypothetical protein